MLARIAFSALVLAAALATAQAEERIERFVSDVDVQRNGDLLVTESIQIRAEGKQIKRGILRDFPTTYRRADGSPAGVSRVRAAGALSAPYRVGRGVHQGVRDLSEVLMRDADHQAGQHRRMFGQRVLDLGRVHVAAADGEHVDPAVGQIQVALVVEPAQIAQGVPGPFWVRAGACGAADIAVGGPTARCRAHEDLPDHAGRALFAVVVEHLHLPGYHPPDRAAPAQPFGAADEVDLLPRLKSRDSAMPLARHWVFSLARAHPRVRVLPPVRR